MKINKNDIERFLKALTVGDLGCDLVEVRLLGVEESRRQTPHVLSAYFTTADLHAVPAALERLQLQACSGAYVTLNKPSPALLARANGQFKAGVPTTGDKDISEVRWFPIDIDPVRPSGTPASDEEHARAAAKAAEVKAYLADLGFAEPIELDSGNGYQMLYKLQNNSMKGENKNYMCSNFVKSALQVLDAKFSDRFTKVDTAVSNPARIWRLPGTLNAKGSECAAQTRAHRMARIVRLPSTIVEVPRAALETLAGGTPRDWSAVFRQQQVSTGGRVSLDFVRDLIARRFPGAREKQNADYCLWELPACPFDANHNRGESAIFYSGGVAQFKCHHDSCSAYHWGEFLARIGEKAPAESPVVVPPATQPSVVAQPPVANGVAPLRFYTLGDLEMLFPDRGEVLVEGLLRAGETLNLIAPPKVGKSLLAGQAALSLALGRAWLGRKVAQKRVVVLDNELRPRELRHRYRLISQAMGVSLEEADANLVLCSLRGQALDILELERHLPQLKELGAGVVVLDALYRMLPPRCDENSNSDVMRVYNAIDRMAHALNAAVLVVHHVSKGSQEKKGTTDLGAGAGAISRATDTHLAFLPTDDEDVFEVKGVVRSFAPLLPFKIKRNFPLWELSSDTEITKIVTILRAENREFRTDEFVEMLHIRCGWSKAVARARLQKGVADGILTCRVGGVGVGNYYSFNPQEK